MADIFISKSTKDHWLASSLCDKLEGVGITCWIAPRDLQTKATQRYADDIVDGIENAKALILILSRDSNKSDHCMNEVTTACDKKKKVFVFQIDEIDNLNKTFNYYLSQEQWIQDFDVKKTGNFGKAIKEIADFLEVVISEDKDSFVDTDYQKATNLQELAKRTLKKRQSYVISLYDENEEESDSVHVYEHLIRLDIVDSEKNDWSSYRFLTVKNDSDRPSTYIVHKECGESKATFEEMRIRAKQGGISGKKLKVESVTEIQPSTIQVFKMYFPEPLQPGEETTIFYRLDWPNEPSAYYMKELSQSVSLIRYKRGVKKLTFAVFEPYRILSSSLTEVDKMNVEHVSNILPDFIGIADEELLKPLHDKQYFGVKYVVDKPEGKAYQIRYNKEEIDEEDDENDDFF